MGIKGSSSAHCCICRSCDCNILLQEEDHTRFDAVAPGSVKSASLDRSKQIRRPANPFDSDSDDEQISSSIRSLLFLYFL